MARGAGHRDAAVVASDALSVVRGVMRGRARWQASRGRVCVFTKVALIHRLKSCVQTLFLQRLKSRLFSCCFWLVIVKSSCQCECSCRRRKAQKHSNELQRSNAQARHHRCERNAEVSPRGFILFAGIHFIRGDSISPRGFSLPGSNCALDRVAGRSLICKILLRDEMRCIQNSRTSPQKEQIDRSWWRGAARHHGNITRACFENLGSSCGSHFTSPVP